MSLHGTTTVEEYAKPPDVNSIQASHPFQVSGHGALLKLPNGRVCKPLIERELSFYQDLDKIPSIVPFVAPFFGNIEFLFHKEKVQKWIDEIQEAEQKHFEDQLENERANGNSEDGVVNPWSLRVSKRTLTSLLKKHNEDFFTTRYLVMGDLTTRFNHPSILDVKIGTRQHGDDAAPDKVRRHIKKVQTTTSSSVGVRLCGQLVWQPESESYNCIDKYEGRKMSPDDLTSALSQFFYNGTQFLFRVLEAFIDKLKQLLVVMQSGVRYRFYSTSLLLLYEGDQHSSPMDPQFAPTIDVKMIDFAHTFPLVDDEVNDDGYIFGLTNLISMLESIHHEKKKAAQTPS